MKDYLTYQMMNEMGVAAPLCSYVYITVNGEDWGLYLAVEGVEESFLQRNYGKDYGELYKPDSMNMGGGRGNGEKFDMDEFMNDSESDNSETNDQIQNKNQNNFPQMPNGNQGGQMQNGGQGGFGGGQRPGGNQGGFGGGQVPGGNMQGGGQMPGGMTPPTDDSGEGFNGQLDGTIGSTSDTQESETLIDAQNLQINDMGSMGDIMGGKDKFNSNIQKP